MRTRTIHEKVIQLQLSPDPLRLEGNVLKLADVLIITAVIHHHWGHILLLHNQNHPLSIWHGQVRRFNPYIILATLVAQIYLIWSQIPWQVNSAWPFHLNKFSKSLLRSYKFFHTLKQIFSPSLKATFRFSLNVLRLRLARMKFSPVSHSTMIEETCQGDKGKYFSFYDLDKIAFVTFWQIQTFPPAVLGSRQALVSRKAFATTDS